MVSTFAGSIVALVTPMHPSLEIDIPSYIDLIKLHLNSKTQGLVILGTTGESATVTSAEKAKLWQVAVDTVQGKIPVIAGTGSYSTESTIAETKLAADCGVNACLVVTPYYNRPTQAGIAAHYAAIAQSTALPLILYNVPKRTGCDLLPETLLSLIEHENIVAIKEATGDLARMHEIKRLVGNRFTLLSGDDSTALDFIASGGQGVVSVAANIVPELIHSLCAAALAGNLEDAREINTKLGKLYSALALESNPIPVKWALSYLGYIQAGIRLPMTVFSEQYHAAMLAGLEASGALMLHQNHAV